MTSKYVAKSNCCQAPLQRLEEEGDRYIICLNCYEAIEEQGATPSTTIPDLSWRTIAFILFILLVLESLGCL